MDEPASALDPIATQKIEELIYDLKRDYTIAIVTAQHAAGGARLRVHRLLHARPAWSSTTAPDKIFTNPGQKITEDYITGRFRVVSPQRRRHEDSAFRSRGAPPAAREGRRRGQARSP